MLEWIKSVNLGLDDNYISCLLGLDDIPEIRHIGSDMWADFIVGEMKLYSNNENTIFFGLRDANSSNLLIGVVECQIDKNSDTGYLVGGYIRTNYRFWNLMSALIELCEEWVKLKGCVYMYSNCYVENDASYNLHIKNGYKVYRQDEDNFWFKKSLIQEVKV